MHRHLLQVYLRRGVAAAVGSRTTGLDLVAACGLAGLLFSHTGCAPILLASAGAIAGYAVSRDSVTLDFDRSWDTAWAASLEEVKRQGRLKKANRSEGRIDAQIRHTDVVVTLDQLTPATVRVVIRARKHLLPQVDVAQRLGVSIARRVG